MMNVLVVDDETLVRAGIVAGVDWQSMGCAVAGEASNGEDGLRMALEIKPDLIITDIRMPRMDGIEMMNRLRAQGCRAAVIVLTAYSDFAYARSALQFGAADYLLKPFADRELENAVRKALHRAFDVSFLQDAPTDAKNAYVQEAMKYVAAHYADENISVTAIAEHLSVSEGHLSHLFKKETGSTLSGYLTRYRVNAAANLLRDCRSRVSEVARAVGYRDVDYFAETFKKLTGVTPSEFQNKGGREG